MSPARWAPSRKHIDSHTFTDHTSSPSLCIYCGEAPANSSTPLPPLFSFAVYVTYGLTLTTAPSDLSQRILDLALNAQIPSQPEPVRCDIYFLPGASTQDIVAHYRGEREAAVERNGLDRLGVPHGPLPDYSHGGNWFKGFALVLDSAGWEVEAGVSVLEFEPPKEMLEEEDPEERWAMLGDTDEEGISLSKGIMVRESESEDSGSSIMLGPMLYRFGQLAGRWGIAERYEQALEEGRTSW